MLTTKARENLKKLLEEMWSVLPLPIGYKLKFVESTNENGETILIPQIVKEGEANEEL